jgi:hypothetical protein
MPRENADVNMTTVAIASTQYWSSINATRDFLRAHVGTSHDVNGNHARQPAPGSEKHHSDLAVSRQVTVDCSTPMHTAKIKLPNLKVQSTQIW